VIVVAERLIVDPAQTGELDDAAGELGIGFTVTAIVAGALVHPLRVDVTEYVPVAAVVAFVIEGVLIDDVNPFGPVHE
jgi:hypothetical protein